jgi:hypothetical protein
MTGDQLLREGEIEGRWVGRTTLRSSVGELYGYVRAAADDERCAASAAFLLARLEEMADTYPPKIAAPIAAPLPAETLRQEHGYPGWAPQAPPEGYYTPPLPFEFLLPVEANDAPMAELAPWWEQVKPPAVERPVEDLFEGEKLRYGTWGRAGWVSHWERGDLYPLGVKSQLARFSDHVVALVQLEQTEERIKAPGTVPSVLIPGYLTVKGLAWLASQRTHQAIAGCRLPFEVISAVWAEGLFRRKAPRFGSKRVKEAAAWRGYGECVGYEVALECSDGWRPYRLAVEGRFRSPDNDRELFRFATDLVQAIASERLKMSHLSETDVEGLHHLTADHMEPEDRGDHTLAVHQVRFDLPGHVPLCAAC